jgi:hypothetical protein
MKFKDEILYKLQDYAYHGIDKKDSEMQYNNLFFSEINEDKFYERVEVLILHIDIGIPTLPR